MKLFLIQCAILSILSCGMPDSYPEERTADSSAGGIFIYPKSLTIRENSTSLFSVYILNSDGTRSSLSPDEVSLQSKSSTVSISGLSVTALSYGTAEISAEYLGMSDSAEVCIRPLPEYSKLRISEVMYDPAEETAGEFIEIFNAGSKECDLEGVTLSNGDAGSKKYLFGGTSIKPGSYLVIGNSESSFVKAYASPADYYGLPFTLRNTAETILLRNPDNVIIDAVYIKKGTSDYPAPSAWGSLSSGDQKSLIRKNPMEDNDIPADFIAGIPTPGK